jgi:hypothetical protein
MVIENVPLGGACGNSHDIQVVTLAQDWIATNVTPPLEVVGSLASEMIKRASEEEQVGTWLGMSLLLPKLDGIVRQRNDVKKPKREKKQSASVFLPRPSTSRCKQMRIGIRSNARGTGRAIGHSPTRQKCRSFLTIYSPNPLTVRLL